MNERILEAISKLKKVQDELEVKLKTIQQNIDEKGSLNMQKALFTVADDLARYTIKDGNWYYNGKDTGIQAEAHDGEDGKQGPQGIPGRPGRDGKNGKEGKPGKDGKDGRPGKDGKNGKDGKPGRDGKDGKDGVIPELKIGKVEVSPEYGGAMAKLRPGKDNIMYLDLTLPRGPQGFTGFDGKDAKINGENTIEIKAGTNITIDQGDKTLTINSTGGRSATWGNIEGTLSDQTDLDTALSSKVSNTDYAGSNKAGVIRTNTDYGTSITSVGALISATKTYQQYQDTTTPNMFISKGTLENVITGKGLVSNTDFANNTTAGVIRTSGSYGTTVSGSGVLNASTLSYKSYSEANNTALVGKGTLENVIAGKKLNLKQLSTFDNTKTQVLKNINGTLTWVDE